MDKKEKFQLNSDIQRKIDNEYYYPQKKQTAAKPKRVSAPVQKQQPKAKRPSDVKHSPPKPVTEEYDGHWQEETPEQIEKRKKRRRLMRKFMIATIAICLTLTLFDIAFFFYRGQIWFNEPRKRDYPVRGAVVDQSLGKVDWKIMSRQTISFAYIRATRGSSGKDEQYDDNRKGINHTDLLSGFYHEFVFGADGKKQAENFIEQCGDMSGRLRPMVKLTRYGIYKLKMKNAGDVQRELEQFLDAVEEEYGRRCVIMCDSSCYKKYIKDDFDDYTLWIIDHFGKPDEDLDWAMWEFNPRVRSLGYENNKKYFSMTVYRQDKDINNFKKYLLMD